MCVQFSKTQLARPDPSSLKSLSQVLMHILHAHDGGTRPLIGSAMAELMRASKMVTMSFIMGVK